MSPNWGIKASVIQLGTFNTDWRKLKVIPIHQAYDTEKSPARQHRAMLSGMQFIGHPERAAKAFITLAETKETVPLRVQLGTDSIALVRHAAKTTLSDSEKLESLAHSTNVDGIDPKEYTKKLVGG